MRKKSRYVLLALCVLALVLQPLTIFAAGSGTYSDPYTISISEFNTNFNSSYSYDLTAIDTYLANYDLSSDDLDIQGLVGVRSINATTKRIICFPDVNFVQTIPSANSVGPYYYVNDSLTTINSWWYYNLNANTGVLSSKYTYTIGNSNTNYIPNSYISNFKSAYVSSVAKYYLFDSPSLSLYYNDISSVSSFTDDDGMVFYTGGLSLIATASPNFYNALLGADGLATWLSSDVEAMFMYDPTNDEWYIMNAPQNLAYFADDHNSVTTLYSGYIDSDNNFVADSRSGSFNQVDITTYSATSGCYKWDGTNWYWSPTYNNVQVGRNANGFYINRGSSITRLAEAPNAEREAVIRGLTINNPFIAHNGDLIAQYLQTEDNRETVVDGDLYSLLNSIKNWEQIDAITQKYLLLAINDVASLTGQVIDYLGPNYQYPTITSYLDSLFAFNGFKYFAYDVNGDTVEYNTNNHPIASALTEFYLMTTTLDNTGRPASTYSYDGQNRVNPLSSLWNDIKNLPQAIANALEPIFPTIPDNNDTIIDTVGDYYNPVSLNPSNMTIAHDGMTDAMEFYNYQAPEGVSFIGIFSDPDRWTLFTEETLNNCGLYIEEGE